jgi:hypothetical protein
MTNKILFLSVDFEEFTANYREVTLSCEGMAEHGFGSGDIVADFKAAVAFARKVSTRGDIIYWMSSCDNWIMDNPSYEYDENYLIVKIKKD